MANSKKTKNKVVSSKLNLDKPISDLTNDLSVMRQDLLDARKSHKAGEMVNPRAITKLRKNIARILTRIRQEEINSQKGDK